MNLYARKQYLTREYEHLTRDDLLWLLAMATHQRATFTGSLHEYFEEYISKNAVVQKVIADVGSGEAAVKELGFKYKGYAGTSNAFLFTATIDGIKIMLKLTVFDERIDEDTKIGVVYETLLFKHFFNYMLDNKITPNVPFYYGSHFGDYGKDQASFLYIEYLFGKTLHKHLKVLAKDSSIPIRVWRSILFQILYTLLCFQQLNIRHNDLHTENIFIDPNIGGDCKYYTSKSTYYLVPLDGIGLVKIFDMDMASVDCTASTLPQTRNLYKVFRAELNKQLATKYTHCDNTKLESDVQPRVKSLFDVFVVFCTILLGVLGQPGYEAQMDSETIAFINRVFSDAEIKAKHRFHCRSDKPNKEVKAYKTLPSILRDEYFLPLRGVRSDTINVFHLPALK